MHMMNIALIRMSWWTLLATMCSLSMLALAGAIVSYDGQRCHHRTETLGVPRDVVVTQAPCAVRCESTCGPVSEPAAIQSQADDQPATSTLPAGAIPNVRKISSHHFAVSRDEIMAWLQGRNPLQGMHILPSMFHHPARGLRLDGIRKDSVAHQLGIQSGDTLVAINDDDSITALRRWTLLRQNLGHGTVKLSMLRKGVSHTIVVDFE
jgi:hypothetical protein